MNERVQSLRLLADKFEQEIELTVQEAKASKLSDTSKETIIEETASMNELVRNMRDSINSIESYCSDVNLNLNDMEVRLITLALERSGGHQIDAAKLLGISSRTMIRRVCQLRIDTSVYKKKKTTKDDNMAYSDK
jgi:transcriptional regulator with PAS, ATPase and Fis domain